MGRIYTTSFSETTAVASSNCNIFELLVGSGELIKIHEIGVSQKNKTGEAADAILLLAWITGYTSSGAGGISPTVVPLLVGDAASGATLEGDNWLPADGGTPVTHYKWHWDIRFPFRMIWTPDTRPVLVPSKRAVFELISTPPTSFTYGAYIIFEEIG